MKQRHVIATTCVLGVGLLYIALLFQFIPLNGLWSGDQGTRIVQITSLLLHRFRDLSLIYPGASIDPEQQFSPLPALWSWSVNSRYYCVYSYPYAFLTAIPFFFFGYAGLYLIPLAATVGTLFISTRLATRLQLRAVWSVPIIIGLATPALFYALVLWEHALAVFLTTLAVMCAVLALERQRIVWMLIAGVCTGVAFWLRSETIWFGPALLVGLLVVARGRWRLIGSYVIGLMLGLLPILFFNMIVFGLPLGPHIALNYQQQQHAAPSLQELLLLHLGSLRLLLLDRSDRYILWGIVMLLIASGIFLPRTRLWLLVALCCVTLWDIATTQSLDLHTGLVRTCPLVLLALWTVPICTKQHSTIHLLQITTCVYVIGVLLSTPNDGGGQWGPRYLLPALPLLIILSLNVVTHMLDTYKEMAYKTIQIAFTLLILCSVAIQARGVEYLQDSHHRSLRLIQIVNSLQHSVILTDTFFGPQLLGPIYQDHTVLWITQPDQLIPLRKLLQRNHVTVFSYMTGQLWGNSKQTQIQAELHCTWIKGLPFSMNLFECRVDAQQQ